MKEQYTSLGLMSGTSGDGVDASIIQSDGEKKYEVIKDKYYEYDSKIYQDIHKLKEKIYNLNDLKIFKKEIKDLERKITLFHAKVVEEIKSNLKIDIIGFHGQTVFHNAKKKLSIQSAIYRSFPLSLDPSSTTVSRLTEHSSWWRSQKDFQNLSKSVFERVSVKIILSKPSIQFIGR